MQASGAVWIHSRSVVKETMWKEGNGQIDMRDFDASKNDNDRLWRELKVTAYYNQMVTSYHICT